MLSLCWCIAAGMSSNNMYETIDANKYPESYEIRCFIFLDRLYNVPVADVDWRLNCVYRCKYPPFIASRQGIYMLGTAGYIVYVLPRAVRISGLYHVFSTPIPAISALFKTPSKTVKYRVSHSKLCKVNWLWWGCTF